MKKFLIVADAASMHTYNYVKYILKDTNYDITIFSISNKKIPDEYLSLYISRNVKLVSSLKNEDILKGHINPVSRFVKFFKKVRNLRKLGKFDICQLEFLNASGCLLLRLNKNLYKYILLTYWGSDILQINKKLKRAQKSILKYSDAITLCTEKMLRKFREEFGNEYDDRLHKVNIIVGTLENVEVAYKEIGIKNSKLNFSLPLDKKIVMCGYNGASAQQQDKIVEIVSYMPQEYKRSIHLIMPFMYGCSDKDYIDRVKMRLAESGVGYTIIEDYQTYDGMAQLALATDIYLQLRFTDALSASMQEQLYAGSVVIRGTWLEYDELETPELPIFKIADMTELGRMLTHVIDNYEKIEKQVLPVYIKNMSSGAESRKQSIAIYGDENER